MQYRTLRIIESKNSSELYEEGLDILLKKWDVKRNIEREQVYKKLSLKRKEDLLSQVAYSTFERERYFFKRKEVEADIIEYIRNLPDCSDDPEALQLDSEAVLKSIEAQHGLFVERARGVYSFSHLTFHEYFTARKIKEAGNDKLLHILAARITETRWREVFLLTVGMLESADSLLQSMKKQVDDLLATDEKLQQFLTWVKQKSESVKAAYKPAAIRAFYLSLDRDLNLSRTLDRDIDRDIDRDFSQDRFRTLDRDLFRDRTLSLCRTLSRTLDRDRPLFLCLTLFQDLFQDLDRDHNSELKRSLQELENQLPHNKDDKEAYQRRGLENSQVWAEKLRTVMIEHRNIGHDWQFTDSQKELLKKYYDANKLLVDCLNSDCYVNRDTRQHIEDTLLLPIDSIPLA